MTTKEPGKKGSGKSSRKKDATGETADEAQVVSLDQMRQKRRQREEAAAAAAAAHQRRLFRAEQNAHRSILQYVLASGRMLFSDLADMIKLGIITDEPDHLPCEIHDRDANYDEWVSAHYGEDAEDPDEDLVDDFVARLHEAGLENTYEVRRIEESQSVNVPPANKVFCPLLAYGEKEDPPCVAALENRFFTHFEDGEMKRVQIAPDPEDPVIRARLHPCVFLGRELYRIVMPGVWKVKEDPAEAGKGEPADPR